jgi:hydroxymethylbilane synthase
MHLMVLPLAECPAAPAQGALAVECRKNDAVVRNMLEKLNDPSVVAEIGWERKLLEDWGGGCHQRFGATCLTHPLIGPLMCVRGKKQDGSYVEEVRWKEPPVPTGEVVSWDGAAITPVAGVTVTALGSDESTAYGGAAVFVAHSKAISEQSVAALTLAKCRVWTSGVASWRRLAKMGIWVEGCAEGLGFLSCVPMLGEPMLSLPPMSEWVVITHGSAVEDWRAEGFSGEIVTTYEAETRYPDEVIRSLSRATHIFWSSGSQYKVLSGYAMPSAVHACGPGRTARLLQENKKNPLVFPSVEEWRRWIRKDAGT